MEQRSLRVGIVAGEASGDYLGANLIRALQDRVPELVVEGIGGPEMQLAGCRTLYPMRILAVMGLVEVLGSYLKLTGVRRALVKYFSKNPPDVFIGIDAPEFNLDLERRLHDQGIKTVHYVSPQVWAWREYRIKKIISAVDLMLTLYPFEVDYYKTRGVPAVCVGHTLADRIPVQPDPAAARARLGLPQDITIIGLMPGSRRMEIARLARPFLLAADLCRKSRKNIHFVSSLLDEEAIDTMRDEIQKLALEAMPISLYKRQSHDVLEAADVTLLASGTITLEAMLYKKPMVVAYKVNWLTYRLLKALVRVKHVSLPNILARDGMVPEFLQDACTPDRLAAAICRWLDDPGAVMQLQQRYNELHQGLRQGAADAACNHVLNLVRGR